MLNNNIIQYFVFTKTKNKQTFKEVQKYYLVYITY